MNEFPQPNSALVQRATFSDALPLDLALVVISCSLKELMHCQAAPCHCVIEVLRRKCRLDLLPEQLKYWIQ